MTWPEAERKVCHLHVRVKSVTKVQLGRELSSTLKSSGTESRVNYSALYSL